jgi:hypothetical protein
MFQLPKGALMSHYNMQSTGPFYFLFTLPKSHKPTSLQQIELTPLQRIYKLLSLPS